MSRRVHHHVPVLGQCITDEHHSLCMLSASAPTEGGGGGGGGVRCALSFFLHIRLKAACLNRKAVGGLIRSFIHPCLCGQVEKYNS